MANGQEVFIFEMLYCFFASQSIWLYRLFRFFLRVAIVVGLKEKNLICLWLDFTRSLGTRRLADSVSQRQTIPSHTLSYRLLLHIRFRATFPCIPFYRLRVGIVKWQMNNSCRTRDLNNKNRIELRLPHDNVMTCSDCSRLEWEKLSLARGKLICLREKRNCWGYRNSTTVFSFRRNSCLHSHTHSRRPHYCHIRHSLGTERFAALHLHAMQFFKH